MKLSVTLPLIFLMWSKMSLDLVVALHNRSERSQTLEFF